MSPDAELLRRYAESHAEEAFAELVRRHLNLVYFAALRRTGGNAALAQDIAQDVFTALARQAASLARHVALTGWLYTTTRNTAAKAMRTEQRRKTREQEAQTMNELSRDAGFSSDWEKLRPVLDSALDELGDHDREAVLMRCLQNRPFAEIGAALRVSEDAARMRVERALEKLRTLLTKRGVTSTASALGVALANQAVATAPAGLAASVTGAALSGAAAAGAGSLAAVIAFMSASKVIISLAAAGALAIALTVYQFNQARAATVALAEASADHAALLARRSWLEGGVKAAEKQLADRESALAPQRAALPAAPATTELSPAALAALAQKAKDDEAWATLNGSDPELKKARLVRGRAIQMAEYRPLFQLLAFTPLQSEQALDLIAAIASFGVSNADREACIATFKERFGPVAGQQFAQFLETRRARLLVNDLSAKTYFSDEPFSPQQREQLVQLVANARPVGTQQKSSPNEMVASAFRRSLDWDKILAQAETFVSPTQILALRNMAALARVEAQLAIAANDSAGAKK